MELRQLRYFVAVAETGNISRAAQKIFLTQPALSRQIKALEDEIGQCLLERRANSVHLTPAGEALLREARDLLHRADEVPERVRAAASAGRLRIGYAPTLAGGLLSAAVARFTQVHPGTQVEMFDITTGEMLAGLEAGKLDVVVTAGQEDGKTRGIEWTSLVRSPWRLAVNSDHALARKQRVTAGELAREPLLILSRRDYPEYWSAVAAWLSEHGARAGIAGEHDGGDSLLAAVAAGLGVAVVTERSAARLPARVRLRTLATPPTPVCIVAGFRTDRAGDKQLAVFVEELRQAAAAFA